MRIATTKQSAFKLRPVPKAMRDAAGLFKRKLMTKYIVSFPPKNGKATPQKTFVDLAKKHIVKGKRGGRRDLSKKIDEIAYGI